MYKFKGIVKYIGDINYVGEKKYPKTEILVKETGTKYPTEVMFNVFGDRACDEVSTVNVGDKVEVSFIVKSKEWKGRYFSEISLISIQAEGKHNYQDIKNNKEKFTKEFKTELNNEDLGLPF